MAHRLTVGHALRLGKHGEGRNNSISGLEAESGARKASQKRWHRSQLPQNVREKKKVNLETGRSSNQSKKEAREHHVTKRCTKPAYS